MAHRKPDSWFTATNPPPPPPVYPPSATEAYAIRVNDPNVSGRCLAHPIDDPDGDLRLMSLDPDDIIIAYATHDHIHHNTTGGPWLIAGDSGLTGDVCNPCAGAVYDKDQGKTVPAEGGPRHDLCYAGSPRRGRGSDCPCTHDKPWMRGVKPGDRDKPRAAERLRALREEQARRAAEQPPPPPAIVQDYLFDPEEEPDHDQNT